MIATLLSILLSTASFTVSAPTPRSLRLGGESFWPHFAQARRPPARTKPIRRPDVIYYPTPDETVAEMLRLANIKPGDVLYDLGSGDGRIPIAAAKQYGIRAVGIEIDPKLVSEARERARAAEVSGLVTFSNADMFRTNIREATVVTLYLSNRINLLLRPKILRELRPGTRIVSHDFHMGDWEPEQTVRVPWKGNLYRTVYLWTVPGKKRNAEIPKNHLIQTVAEDAGKDLQVGKGSRRFSAAPPLHDRAHLMLVLRDFMGYRAGARSA